MLHTLKNGILTVEINDRGAELFSVKRDGRLRTALCFKVTHCSTHHSCVLSVFTLIAPEEDRNGTGAGVASYSRSDIVYKHLFL